MTATMKNKEFVAPANAEAAMTTPHATAGGLLNLKHKGNQL